ncbi:tRNA cyclic N6-threonylcarbamoyladenosine(37) synthase TcdA [Pokkaliibacter sp. CJK22405]|uniref:tRNA cyclic N6-threonylcarbamoyladenosine(37) synthase TcdA n=1 Tax=Pokkaliibacter sp. CJK22405 TaxID=3384615 RepID=UPI003984EC8D
MSASSPDVFEPSEAYLSRFSGIARLYGLDALHRFAKSHVCVIGIGGVGSWAAEALARTGFGKITLIDLDEVCISNVNRQLHAMGPTVGKSKVDVMAERILAINPECDVIRVDDFIGEDNQAQLLGGELDYVVDAIDSVRAKAALLNYCKRNKIPVVTTGGAGGQTDPTQILVADLAKTKHDPLAARVRNQLRRQYGFAKGEKAKFGIECVYSTEQLRYPSPDGTVCHQKPEPGEGPVRLDCAAGFGAVTMVTASFGMVAASRVASKIAAKV